MGRVRNGRNAALGALVASALAAGAFTPTPAANATCMSAFGLNNGNGCTSNLTTLAIAIGNGASANAGNALFGGAIAIGDGANVLTNIAAFTFGGAFGYHASAATLGTLFGINLQFGPGTASTLGGAFNFLLGAAAADSAGSATSAIGLGNIVVQLGAGTAAAIGGLNVVAGLLGGGAFQQTGASGLGNLALQIGAGTVANVGLLNVALSILYKGGGLQNTTVGGIGAWGLNLLGDAGSVFAQGIFTTALNLWGTNTVAVQGLLSAAANIIGTGNVVELLSQTGFPVPLSLVVNSFGIDNVLTALNGPLSFVNAFNLEAQTLFLKGPGINFNNFRLPPLPQVSLPEFHLPAESNGSTNEGNSTGGGGDSTDGVASSGRHAASLRTTANATPVAAADSTTATPTSAGDTTTTTASSDDGAATDTATGGRHRKPETVSDSGDSRPSAGTASGGRHRKPDSANDAGDSGAKSTAKGAGGSGGGKHRKP